MPQFYDFQREILNKLFSALSGGGVEVEAKCATSGGRVTFSWSGWDDFWDRTTAPKAPEPSI